MEIIRLAALFLVLSFLLVSCSASPKELLFYQEKSFRAHVSWQINSINAVAILTSHHDLDLTTIEFTAPPALVGVSLKKHGEEISISIDDLQISSPELSRLAEISKIFEISGSLKSSSVESISGIKLNRIEIIDAKKNKKHTLYLYKNSSLPRKITSNLFGKETTFDIISFEFIN